MGVELIKTYIPPNLEEFVGVLLFMATILCTLYVQSVRLLTLNLFVALLVSLGGLFVISSNPDVKTLPQLRFAKFGVFLPVIFAAVGLLFALHCKLKS
jgi:hypothetical protein